MVRFLILLVSLFLLAGPVHAGKSDEDARMIIAESMCSPSASLIGLKDVDLTFVAYPQLVELSDERLRPMVERILKNAGLNPSSSAEPNIFIIVLASKIADGYEYTVTVTVNEKVRPVRDPDREFSTNTYSKSKNGECSVDNLDQVVFEEVHEFTKEWALANVSNLTKKDQATTSGSKKN